jgi:extradiol dioxygenase family protein
VSDVSASASAGQYRNRIRRVDGDAVPIPHFRVVLETATFTDRAALFEN